MFWQSPSFRSKLKNLFGIDLRSLALFRISIALIVLYELICRSDDLAAFYADSGVLPRAALLMTRQIDPRIISLHFISGAAPVQALIFLLHGLCALGLLVGFRTRQTTFLTWILTVSMRQRNPFLITAGDDYLCLLLFWGMFLPLGAVFSIDTRRTSFAQPSEPVLTWATAALLLQTFMVYSMAAVFKWKCPAWQNGSALYTTLNFDFAAKQAAQLILLFPALVKFLSYSVLWFESVGPWLLFISAFNGLIRTMTFLAFILIQLGFHFFLYLRTFPFICMAAMIPFLPSYFWNSLFPRTTQIQTASNVDFHPSIWSETVVIGSLLCVFSWNIWTLYPQTLKLPADGIMTPCVLLHLDQNWDLYAPPPTCFGWYVARGKLNNGSEVNLLRGGQPLSWAKPTWSSQYKNELWEKYVSSMFPMSANRLLWLAYARSACRLWNARHAWPQHVQALQIVFLMRNVPPPDHIGVYKKVILFNYP